MSHRCGGWKFNMKCWLILLLMRTLSLACRRPLSHYILVETELKSKLSRVSFYKGINLIRRTTLSQFHLNLITSQRHPIPNTITLGVRTSTCELGGRGHNSVYCSTFSIARFLRLLSYKGIWEMQCFYFGFSNLWNKEVTLEGTMAPSDWASPEDSIKDDMEADPAPSQTPAPSITKGNPYYTVLQFL